MRFPDLVEAAERQPCSRPGLLGGQTCRACIPFGEFEVRLHLVLQFPVEARAADEREQALQRGPHDFAPRKRATSAVECSQLAISARSCLVPALVSS